MRLSAGRSTVEVDGALAERCRELEPFRSAGAHPSLRLRWERAPVPEGALPMGAEGAYRVAGDEVKVWIPGSSLAAEASLRLAFAVAFQRQGGLLLHAAGICFEGRAFLGVGPSGCGKSTLAQRCADAGAEVLSDETVGWSLDGALWATPFRSSARYEQRGGSAPLRALAFLEHGAAERLEPLPGAEAVKRLLAQTYRTPGAPTLRAAAALAARSWRLSFRDDPEAAAFVRRACLDSTGRRS